MRVKGGPGYPAPPSFFAAMRATIETVEMRGIVKRFPGVVANDHVDFDVRAGEIHALLGENGAGKSTLMKILYGMYQPDSGEILVDGEEVRFRSPLDAIRVGIGMVHQHFMLVEPFTVAENVALGLPSSRRFVNDLDRVSARIQELAGLYGFKVDPRAYVWQLSVGEQQRVEILKVLYRGASVLILDEPTAVLTPQEVEGLFRTLRCMKEDGHAIVFISHKLNEVLSISDRITVLRGGRVVGTVPSGEATVEGLARMMVGREVVLRLERPEVEAGEVVLEIEDLWAMGDRAVPALRGVNLGVRAGEIVGLAGVSGNGQRELAEVIVGLRKPLRGRVRISGQDVTGCSPEELIRIGLSHIPEERMHEGGIPEFSVEDNLVLKDHRFPPFSRGIFLNFPEIARYAERLIRDFDIRTPSRRTPLKSLSGGNIQKLILARELSRSPKVLIAAQPTRGLDISATEYVRRRILEQRARDTAVLLISDDLDEILSLSDRIAVIYEGRIMGVMEAGEADIQEIGLMMAGVQGEREGA